ncbi:hypothetical protein GCM10011379_30150 [Filimonas zeae]|uniref:Lipoprotein n=2 Tax=Filimonas zeae TaxID=1737353 RepID=A0A917J246_9BACT|nr:hypothetical protein GCM10011379_30150 [Filimonas zeae]
MFMIFPKQFNKMKNLIYPVLGLMLCATACTGNDSGDKPEFTYDAVKPVDFPASLAIPGFQFPQDSTTLNKWISESKDDSIYLHGWGIWTGITSFTAENTKGDSIPLRVYETWLSPEEMIDSIKGIPLKRSNRTNLKIPHQLTHFGSALQVQQSINDSIHESVSYSPAASSFAIQQKIFMATALKAFATQQRTQIPFFPNNAITIKPVFKLLPATSGQKVFSIATWHGPIDSLASYHEKDWGTYVNVDITNTIKDSNTYPLNDFIHYRLNAEDAYYFNKQFTENSGNKWDAKAGDVVILVAMHVGTREITNWTWQSFWWAPDADNPPAPSSPAIAALRPAALKGAARHYAMTVAYYMVNPKEPYSGTNVTGKPNYAFNPYLEAGFGPGVFNDSISYIATAKGEKVYSYAGVRTNCMSCHRMATANPDSLFNSNNSNTPYVGNSYVSVNDSLFKNQLLLDFAWSIQGNIDTTGWAAYIASQQQKKK